MACSSSRPSPPARATARCSSSSTAGRKIKEREDKVIYRQVLSWLSSWCRSWFGGELQMAAALQTSLTPHCDLNGLVYWIISSDKKNKAIFETRIRARVFEDFDGCMRLIGIGESWK